MMETALRDHIELMTEALGMSSKNVGIDKILTNPLTNGELVSFIYKPSLNGWITVVTSIKKGMYEISIYSNSNKADREKERMGKETLYFDTESKKTTIANPNLSPLQAHFNRLIDEIDPHLDTSQAEFQPNRLKKYLSLPIM